MSTRSQKPKDVPPPSWPLKAATEWHDEMEQLKAESDRGVALLGAAYLDTALEQLIRASLACPNNVTDKLLKSPGPLSTFSARIALAYGLGHIGPHYFTTLEAIREVRNAFAHFRRRLSFEDQEIQKLVKSGFKLPYVISGPPPDLSLMRNRYIWTTATVLTHLTFLQVKVKPPAIAAGT